MSNDQKAVDSINARVKEIENILRIVQNTFNLVNDTDIKGGHAHAVAEIMGWLSGFGRTLQSQIDALKASLPKQETPTVVEAEAEVVEAKA